MRWLTELRVNESTPPAPIDLMHIVIVVVGVALIVWIRWRKP